MTESSPVGVQGISMDKGPYGILTVMVEAMHAA